MTAARDVPLHASPFSGDFLDVAELNAHVSSRLHERIAQVRRAALEGTKLPTAAVTVLGAAGGGKTHLFVRLRHQLDPRSTLVLMRPYFGVSLSLRDVLAALVDQMCLPGHDGTLTPFELLTAHWLGQVDPPSVDGAIAAVVSRLPEMAPATHLARAVFTLGEREPPAQWAELAWLSGREPREPRTPDRVEGPAPADAPANGNGVLGEGDCLHMLRFLGVLAAPVAPIVLVFDQLENLASDDPARVLGYGNLVSEMVDSLACFTIVQLALTSEWMQAIEPRLSLSQKTRLASDTLLLETPDRQKRELLLRAWFERFASRSQNGRKTRFPRPLSESDLETLLTAPGMTPRLLLAAFARGLAGHAVLESAPAARPAPEDKALWASEHQRVRRDLEEKERSGMPLDAAELAEALASALSFVPHLEVATRTERERVLTAVNAPGHQLTLVYLTSLHHVSVGATLARATELAQTGKVVIVREKRFELPRSWETVGERRAAFESLPNARWLWLDGEEAGRCLTVARLSSRARAKRLRHEGADEPLSLAEVREEIRQASNPSEWESVVSIGRWLSDVPRSDGAAPRIASRASSSSPATAVTAPEPIREASASVPAAVPAVLSLREWLSMGRALGTLAIREYAEKVRRLRRGG
jgi:hypothetical protein